MQPTHPQAEVPPYPVENSGHGSTYKESDPPPSYNEINSYPPSYAHHQHTSNYGACPSAPPPPYTPSPSRLPSVSGHRTPKGEYIPESGITIPLNGSSTTTSFQSEESSSGKKYAAYICCAVFLLIVMFAAYLGRNGRKYHSHYRYNYDWNY